MIFNDDCIKISIVYTEAKIFFSFLHKENESNCFRVTDLNELFIKILI